MPTETQSYPCMSLYEPKDPTQVILGEDGHGVLQPESAINQRLNNCTTCLHFIDDVKGLLEKGNSTIIPLIHMIAEICHKIYGPAAKECYNITHHTDEWIQDMLHNSSKTICHEMGQC